MVESEVGVDDVSEAGSFMPPDSSLSERGVSSPDSVVSEGVSGVSAGALLPMDIEPQPAANRPNPRERTNIIAGKRIGNIGKLRMVDTVLEMKRYARSNGSIGGRSRGVNQIGIAKEDSRKTGILFSNLVLTQLLTTTSGQLGSLHTFTRSNQVQLLFLVFLTLGAELLLFRLVRFNADQSKIGIT